jgi:hypothetical protein
MKYLCLVYGEERKLQAMDDAECMTCGQALQDSGHLVAAEPLQPVHTASTLRVRDGKVTITDGPFAETKEQLLGFYVVECDTLEEAIEIAREMGRDETGGFEVRPLRIFEPGVPMPNATVKSAPKSPTREPA